MAFHLNDTTDLLLSINATSSSNQDDFTLVAQNITCAYPISDIYAPTPRYLYYCLLFLTFATLRYRWLSNIFLGAAVAYAASAAIHAFIIASSPPKVQSPAIISIPFIPSFSNRTRQIESLVTNTSTLIVQPDAVELDIDPITAVVVTAYLVGLPLQIWSRTMRSSRIIRYMIFFWNLCMLAGTICALVSWPATNLASPQYRFCYAGFGDPDEQTSDGWDASNWMGTWNKTVWNIFENPDTVWQALSNNCFYPCFNTTQVIRQSSSLKAVVTTRATKFAKLHNPSHNSNDKFGPMLYLAIIVFSVAQFLLYMVSILHLGSDALRRPIHEPHRLWNSRRQIWKQLHEDAWRSCSTLKSICIWLIQLQIWCFRVLKGGIRPPNPMPSFHFRDLFFVYRLLIDSLALITLVAGFTLFPVVVVAFIGWIEWYIRNDGSSNESINQVGQWSPLVSVAVILLAALLYRLEGRLASDEEIVTNIQKLELCLRKLRGRLEERSTTQETQELH